MSYQSIDVESINQPKMVEENLVRENEFGTFVSRWSKISLLGLTIILGALFLFSNNGASHIASKFTKTTSLSSKSVPASLITLSCSKTSYAKKYIVDPTQDINKLGVTLKFTSYTGGYTANFYNNALLDSNGIFNCPNNNGVHQCPFFDVCDFLDGRW